MDYNLSEKDTFFARYTYAFNLRQGEGPLATNVQSALNGVENAHIGGQSLSGSWNRVISAHTINELRGGYSTDPQNYSKADNTDYNQQFGIAPFLEPNAFPGFPHFIISSINLGSGDYRPLKVGEKNTPGHRQRHAGSGIAQSADRRRCPAHHFEYYQQPVVYRQIFV